MLAKIAEIGARHGLIVGNIFHAGDGNMHPIILFDPRKPGELDAAQQVGFEILEQCIEMGGSITGEHGVGVEKIALMPKQFPEETLDALRDLKRLFDPAGLFNPGKILPTGRGCIEIRQGPLTHANTI
jgi:glycolate oxidase